MSEARIAGEDRPLFRVRRDGETVELTIARRTVIGDDTQILLRDRHYPFTQLVRVSRSKQGGAGFSGEHHPDGIYLLSGPAAERASGVDSLHVLDIAPTLAALLDLPISPLWTGRPALEPRPHERVAVAEYAPPSAAGAAPVEIDEALKEKLRALGYLE